MTATLSGANTVAAHSRSGALTDLEACLGRGQVMSDPAVLALYARSTRSEHPGATPSAVLLPTTTEQVIAIVEIAKRWRTPLYPISGGKNWGYGEARPTGQGQFIVDLKRLNRIIEVNRELGYAVIEPGVTQGQLHAYLAEHEPTLWADSTGAGPDASIVGNTLERGFGHTRLGDHFQNCCGMEVVLANGRLLKTGFGHVENAKTTYAYRPGVGPVLDGLFSQSNFGIVTRLGVWLMPKPEAFCAFFVFAERHEQLCELVDGLGTMRREGLLQSAVHIGNDLRVLSGRTQYPWQEARGQTPLPEAVLARLRAEHGVSPWAATGILTGSPDVVRALKRTVKRRLAGFRVLFLDDRKLAWAEAGGRVLAKLGLAPKLRAQLKIARPLYDFLKGVPNREALRGTLWRVRDRFEGELSDPLTTSAGFTWVSPIVPLVGAAAREVTELMSGIYRRHGFDPLISYTLITERALCCVSNIAFDKRVASEVEAARACYAELTGALVRAGYPLYRASIEGFESLSKDSHGFWEVVRALKHALDPHDLMSPGRYLPPSSVARVN